MGNPCSSHHLGDREGLGLGVTAAYCSEIIVQEWGVCLYALMCALMCVMCAFMCVCVEGR